MSDIAPQAAPERPQSGSASPILAPEQVASMRESWLGAGLDPAAFDIAAQGGALGSQEGDTGPSRADADDQEHDALTPAQAAEMADALIKAGMSPEEVAAALKADGYEADAMETRTEDELAFDAAFPTTKPEDIHVNYIDRLPATSDITALAELNREATAWASSIGFPPGLAASVIERGIDVGRAYGSKSEPARGLWKIEQKQYLEHVSGGPEKAAEKITLAAKALSRAGPAFTAGLHASHALDDAGMILHLANQQERLSART